MAQDDGTGAKAPDGDSVLSPVHTALPVLASGRFDATWPPWRLVTFLNRSLKDRGLVFGLSMAGGEAMVTIYDTGKADAAGAPAAPAQP